MERSRVLIVASLLLLPLAGLEARILWLQVLHPGGAAGDLVNRSIDLAPAPRGRILDRAGRVLAEDVWSFDLHVVIEEFEKRPSARADLLVLLGRPPAELDAALEEIYRRIEKLMSQRPERERPKIFSRERKTPYPLFKSITKEAAYAIETRGENFPGLVVREGLRRHYPYRDVGAHVVGYLGRASGLKREQFQELLEKGYFSEGFDELIGEEEVELLARRGLFDGTMTPRDGVERTHDDRLRGHPGLIILERDPATGKKNWVGLAPPRQGEDVTLSIDIELQKDLAAILGEARGEDGQAKVASAIVADPETGAILALQSSASFDPNAFIPPTRSDQVDAYLKSPQNPLLNRLVKSDIVLGSIFKIATSIAALEKGHVRPQDSFLCAGRYRPELPGTNCWIWNKHGGMHGEVKLAEALEQSCNCYFYALGDRMPLRDVAEWASRLGFGERTGIDLPAEWGGKLPRPDEKRYARWRPGDSYSLYIGQHELTVTPVQVLKMICAVANGGSAVTPALAMGGPPPRSLGLKPSTLATVREGLKAVVHGERGTAHQTDLRNVDAAGKTGSATFNAREHKSHAWFAGYAPADKPRFAIVVLVEDGGSGGHTAAPLAAKIAARVMAEAPPK
ncbi:MAG TPA: penicillin-binding transpeptidase domain-containing protein [Planctomycetota bacterium]|nr:penicillin-binding transpeptidase domain-containing protein [Planctomycetota bacterium]